MDGAEVDAALLGEAGYVRDDGLWWARSMRQVFDAARFFAPIEVHDAFGNPPTRIAYDDSVLFAASVTDAMGNVVSAEHDYRVLAPQVVIDANGSRGGVVFDGRGMVVATYVAGRPGSGLRDTPEDPTSTMDYDLFAWRDRGEPNVVHTRTRERHGDPTTRWLEQWVYSDGTGHEILRKASAEPGDAPLRGEDGALVLGPDGAPVVGSAAPRYVGSGRTVFDNKGQVVKQYEPYFSRTPGYEAEVELREHGVTAIVHYDVIGRVVRTELPNGTFSRTEHGGWVQRAWDPNDTVPDSEWFAARAGGALGVAEQRAAVLTAAHADTPTTVHVDALGRTCVIEEHAGFVGNPALAVLHATRLELDVVGNVVAVVDARGNTAEARVFGMLGQVLRTDSEDAGWRVGLADVAGSVVRSWNARGFTTRLQYDSLRRATHQFVTPPGGDEIVVARTVYGEQLAEPARTDANLRGRVFRVYDGAGVVTNAAYDFEGNLVAQERRLAVAFATTQDWAVLDGAVPPSAEGIAALTEAALEAEVFATASEYDALHRVTSGTTPDGSQTLSTYNDAGLLEAVAVRIRGAATATTFVSGFDYDARGQRQRCVHGNGTVTTYAYDPRTFRLVRLRLVREADAAVLQDLQYTYDPVGNITEIRDGAQQAVYFANAVVSADQRFEYDALYRLVRAEGREHASLGQPTDADFSFGPQPHPDDPAALRRYQQDYAWDEVGNLAQLRHVAGSGSFTRRYVYAAAGNRLLANSAPGEAALPFWHSYTYDEHGNMTSMPHLAAIAWDHADRMQHCDLGGGGDVWFVYDAGGERVRKVQVNVSGSAVRERVYLGGYEVYRERAANSAAPDVERQTLHVGDDRGKLALVETLTIDGGDPVGAPSPIQRHQYGNHLGSASLELDEAAAVISYEEFHPFGTTSYAANDAGIEVSTKRYRYIGKERDEETGLYHLGARYYASWLGRWTAADPIGLGDGVNRYAYARGRPLIVVDPSGTSGELLGDLLERQMALAIDLNRATTDPQREIIAEEMLGVNREVAAELTRLNTQARAEQSIAASDVSERVRLASSTRTQASMSTGAPDDVYTRASDPKDLVRAELAQMKGLGRLANVAFQKGSARLESWGVVEPMSDNERRVRALSAGDMMDTLTDLPAGGAGRRIEIHRDGRPLKNRSGDLDDSSRARRTQPHGVDAPAEERAPLPSGLGTKVSQRQLRHVKGRQEWIDRGEGSYLHSMNDAQAVLDAVHNGTARVLGTTRQGHVVVEFEGVTGFNNNPGAGFVDQPTNVFMIKGTAKPSVVPTSPGWKPPTSR